MTCSEIIQKLTELKKRIEFLQQRKYDKRRVAKRLYSKENLALFWEGLESEYSKILPREYWDKIDPIIEKLQNPDLEELGAFPFKKEFLEKI